MSQPLTPWTHRSMLPDFTRIYRGESAWWWRPLIGSFSRLYGLGVSMRLRAYRTGLLKMKTLDGFVLSVGNLTAGGTGKTPAVMMLGKWAEAEGYRVAVLSRGYGGCYKEKVLALSDGHGPRVDSRVSGDEPVLLARNLDGVPVVLSRKRYLAGVYARQRFGSDFFILDDGFQHVALKRDLDVVLIDAGDPFGNGRLLPLGPLREPMGNLSRAHVFIVTRWRENAEVAWRMEMVRKRFPSTPVFFAEHKPEKVIFPNTGENYGPDYIRGKRVVAFAGIARPEVFHRTITEMGAQVVYFEGFGDHQPFTNGEIAALNDKKRQLGAHCILTTEKDWWRLGEQADQWKGMGYLKIEFSLIDGTERFFELIRDRARKNGVV